MRLIEKVWFQQHKAKWLLVPLLLPLTLVFWLLTFVRRMCYRTGLFKSFNINAPVIVVGNIGIGGNGKTPVVVFLIEQCEKLGLKAGVVSRGYGGSAPHYPYLLDETSTANEAGDEPILIHSRCSVPVVVGSDRVAAANVLVEQGCDIIIADDGLQHYRLQRDLEIIVVDAKRKFGNGLLLPAGPLREGQWRLKTADFIIHNLATRPSNNKENKAMHSQLNMVLGPECVCNILTGEQLLIEDFIKDHAKVNAMAGIGDPARFFNTLLEQKFSLNETIAFVDHHHFCENDVDHLSPELALLMTEKDAVKCKLFAKKNWWYVPISAEFTEENKNQLIYKIQTLTSHNIKSTA